MSNLNNDNNVQLLLIMIISIKKWQTIKENQNVK
jgi:hypothetical protein